MIHYVHVVHIDPERAAAAGKTLLLLVAAWLAWHFLPEGWSMVSMWLGPFWHTVTAPFVWLVDAVGSAFRVAAIVQAVLLPVWAVLAGCCIGREDVKDGAVLWLGAAGLNALCAVLQGYPMLAGMVVVGSTAAFIATTVLQLSLRSWTGWLAAALVAGLAAWGMERYGTAFVPLCWLLVPLSWCCLALGAAYGVRCEAGGWRRDREAARLLLLASAMALAGVGPFAVDAARAAGFLPGAVQPAPAQPAPAVTGHAPTGGEAAGTMLPARLPRSASVSRGGGKSGKPAGASPSTRPRT